MNNYHSSKVLNLFFPQWLDVIEPKDFPHVACPTPNGIYMDALKKLLIELSEKFDCVGFSILEFMPHNSQATEDVKKIVKLINDLNVH